MYCEFDRCMSNVAVTELLDNRYTELNSAYLPTLPNNPEYSIFWIFRTPKSGIFCFFFFWCCLSQIKLVLSFDAMLEFTYCVR